MDDGKAPQPAESAGPPPASSRSFTASLRGRLKVIGGALASIAAGGAIISGLLGYWNAWTTVKQSILREPAPAASNQPPPRPSAISPAGPAVSARPRLSLVVLPFANLNRGSDQDYFTDSVTDDVTTDLSRMRDAFVISRDTAFTYRGKELSADQIGRDLNVRYILRGSVQRDGQRVRVNAQLVSSETGATLWADRFDKDLTDLFRIQDEITTRVSSAVDATLVALEGERSRQVLNPDAYDLTARARAAFYGPATRESAEATLRYATAALKLDPDNVGALVVYARAEGKLASTYYVGDAPAAFERADRAVSRALQVAPDYAEAYLARSQVYFWQRKPQAAYDAALKCVELGPNIAYCRALRGFTLHELGRPEDGPKYVAEAIALDPRSPLVHQYYFYLGNTYVWAEKPESAIEWLEKAVELSPRAGAYVSYLAIAYELAGRHPDAQRTVARLRETLPSFTAKTYLAAANSENAIYLAQRRKFADVLVAAGLPRE